MPVIDYENREVGCKVVYYGPAMSGKTTNLQYLHECISEGWKGQLISFATAADRTIYFDLLPLEAETVHGLKVKMQVYTVPGQVYYNSTRQLVLQGADGVVFVGDSQWGRMRDNLESLRDLEANLQQQQRGLNSVPYVLQYNKRDLQGIAPPEYLDFLLNRSRVPAFQASAATGLGVVETLETICKLILYQLGRGT